MQSSISVPDASTTVQSSEEQRSSGYDGKREVGCRAASSPHRAVAEGTKHPLRMPASPAGREDHAASEPPPTGRGAVTEEEAEEGAAMPASLALLLRQYLTIPSAAPTSADQCIGEPEDESGDGSREIRERAAAAAEQQRMAWCRLLPAHWHHQSDGVNKPTSHQPAAPSSVLATSLASDRESDQRPPQPSSPSMTLPHTHSTTLTPPEDASGGGHGHALNRKALWFLLTHYPHDVSACLSLSLGLCSMLDVMRQTVPPPATLLSEGLLRCLLRHPKRDVEEEWGQCTRVTEPPACDTDEHVVLTCPCGCVVDSRYIDPTLYRFHREQYRYYQTRRLCCSTGISPFLSSISVSPSMPVAAESRDETVMAASQQQLRELHYLRSEVLAPPPVLPQQPSRTTATTASAPSSSPSTVAVADLRASLQVQLLPLLALQALALFVWKGSEKQCAVRRRQRQRQHRQATQADSSRASARSQGHNPRLNANVSESHTTHAGNGSRQPPLLPSLLSSSPSADFADAYAFFCNHNHRLWAVMACVLLAWGHLQQRRSCAVFIPQLTAVPSPSSSSSRSGTETCVVSDVLAQYLLHSYKRATVGVTTAADAHRVALLEMRLRLLEQQQGEKQQQQQQQSSHRECRRPRRAAACSIVRDVTRLPAGKELLSMETFVFHALGGQTGQLPLWCAVAVEVLQLYAEQRRHGHTLRSRAVAESRPGGEKSLEEQEWMERVYCAGVRQLVLLSVRLLLLPAVQMQAGAASLKRAGDSGTLLAPARTQPVPRHTTLTSRVRERVEGDVARALPAFKRHRAESDSGRSVAVSNTATTTTAAAANLQALELRMAYHPLFGVAVAVASGAVPLGWAAACVTPTSAASTSFARALPAPSSLRCGDAAKTTAAWQELMQLVSGIHRWLRNAEGQP